MTLAGARVLVTGATGFLGGALARRLASEGATVRALVRTPAKADFLRGLANVEILPGDVTDHAGLRAAADGCSVVFHCAAAFTDWRTQQAVNVTGTRHVAEAVADAGASRLVHVSTIAVYGYRPSGIVSESAPMIAARGDPYNLTKIEAESVVHEIGGARGLSYAIIRPGMIYGPGGGMWTRTMAQIARRRLLLFPGDGGGSAHPIHVDDVAELTVLLATHPSADGETFNCAPDPAPTWRDFLGAYRRLAGRGSGGWIGLPTAPLKAVTQAIATLAPAHTNLRDTPDLLTMMGTRVTFSTAKARERLGWTSRVSLSDGIDSCASWLRAQGVLR